MNGPYPTFERPNGNHAGSEPRRSADSPAHIHRGGSGSGSPRQPTPRTQHSQPQMRTGTPGQSMSPPPPAAQGNGRPTTYGGPAGGGGGYPSSDQRPARESVGARRSVDMRRTAHNHEHAPRQSNGGQQHPPPPESSHSPTPPDPRYDQERHRAPPPPQPVFGGDQAFYDARGGASPEDAEADDFFSGRAQDPYDHSAAQSIRDEAPASVTGPLLDQSHLRPGAQAALLSHERTLELYRANAKKTQDPDIQFEFAVFMIDASKTLPIPVFTGGNVLEVEKAQKKRDDLVLEATSLLKRLADRGHAPSQYFLADCYANGLGTPKNKQDFDRAYPLFVLAAKHGHPDAAYRAGTCCENGWGCRRESAKALTFFRKAAAALHPGAMYRLGVAELNGELGLSRHPKDGVQWLKRSAEHATAEFPHALHELALLHERGIDNVLFVDYEYSAELLAQAAELGYAPSAYRLGECYEYGKMGCPQDPALSIHYYNIAAQQSHRDACFALTAWYLVGSPGVLPQSDTEAYLWARKAAEAGLAKAMYAVGYFLEVGIGAAVDTRESMQWYKRAADLGDRRAAQRLKGGAAPTASGAVTRDGSIIASTDGTSLGKGGKDKDKDCVIM